MWHRLKRLGRYLVGNSRTVLEYDWQSHEAEVTGFPTPIGQGVGLQGDPPVVVPS